MKHDINIQMFDSHMIFEWLGCFLHDEQGDFYTTDWNPIGCNPFYSAEAQSILGERNAEDGSRAARAECVESPADSHGAGDTGNKLGNEWR